MKRLIAGITLVVLTLTMGACDSTPSEATTVTGQQNAYLNNQPVHVYDYSPERDALQQIYDARMKTINTWTIIVPPANSGLKPYVCPSVDYPIPYTTQLTNPSQETNPGTTANAVIPQPEPNGLYTGQTNGTWVRCVRTLPGGGSEVTPLYSEPDALCFPYPITVSADGTISDAGGNSSVSIKSKK